MRGICLVSGGLDSTLSLVRLLQDDNKVLPMFINYNHWATEGELDAAKKVYNWLGCLNKYLILPLIELKVSIGNEKVGSVWGRGIAMVGIASMWAYTHGDNYDFIALGNHKGDVSPDCKPGQFDEWLNGALRIATKDKMALVLPVYGLTTEDIGREVGKSIPFDLMYSCYWYPPCGYKSENESYRCPGCRRKVIAMKAAGITDKKLLELPNCMQRTYQSELAEKVGY